MKPQQYGNHGNEMHTYPEIGANTGIRRAGKNITRRVGRPVISLVLLLAVASAGACTIASGKSKPELFDRAMQGLEQRITQVSARAQADNSKMEVCEKAYSNSDIMNCTTYTNLSSYIQQKRYRGS